MNNACASHEAFMNRSRTILPRVGGGVGVGVREACIPTYYRSRLAAEWANAWALRARVSGGSCQ